MRLRADLTAYLTCFSLLAGATTGWAVDLIDHAYFPLITQGVDMMDDGEGAEILIASRPVVIGPVPESLVRAVLLPYRLESVMQRPVAEANLARLSRIRLDTGPYEAGQPIGVNVDLRALHVPASSALDSRQVVEATLAALRMTLRCADNAVHGRYRFTVSGPSDPSVVSETYLADLEVGRSATLPDASCPPIIEVGSVMTTESEM